MHKKLPHFAGPVVTPDLGVSVTPESGVMTPDSGVMTPESGATVLSRKDVLAKT